MKTERYATLFRVGSYSELLSFDTLGRLGAHICQENSRNSCHSLRYASRKPSINDLCEFLPQGLFFIFIEGSLNWVSCHKNVKWNFDYYSYTLRKFFPETTFLIKGVCEETMSLSKCIYSTNLRQYVPFNDCPVEQSDFGSMISSECSSGNITVSLMVKLRLPFSAARFISSPIFFAICIPSSPTLISLSLVSSALILSRPTERAEKSKIKKGKEFLLKRCRDLPMIIYLPL